MSTPAESLVRDNLDRVRERIAAACARVGRDPARVRLVAVTKYASADAIRALIDAGVTDLGESRVQQLVRRADVFGAALGGLEAVDGAPVWHLVGHLQRNKVRGWLGVGRVLHSLDSERLVREVEFRAAALGARVDVFVEVNLSGERTKGGVSPDEAGRLVSMVRGASHLRLRGLMTMAPLTPRAEDARTTFRGLRDLLASMRAAHGVPHDCDGLSMGMSHDFEIAIEEGATLVRVGSALFEGVANTSHAELENEDGEP